MGKLKVEIAGLLAASPAAWTPNCQGYEASTKDLPLWEEIKPGPPPQWAKSGPAGDRGTWDEASALPTRFG
jgi:hypothetical protein